MNVLYSLALLVPILADYQGVTFHSSEQTFDNIASQGYVPEPLEPTGGKCQMFKVAFMQNYFEQYLQYETSIPELKEFTLCYWLKFYNHSSDHPIFSYGNSKQPREIYSWISNSEQSSYITMSIAGQTFYRLNYPLKTRKWYHTCQSWNGKTGEWQIWVNAERVGRGFHNRLVGHVIPADGTAISGQDFNKDENKAAAVGLQGELTMLQLYSVALTAGKAHKDHKHHHAHKFDHNGVPITTPAPTTPNNRPTLPTHPFLTGGQINHNVRINVAGAENNEQPNQPQLVQGQAFNAQFLNGQFLGNTVTQQFLKGQAKQQQQPQLVFDSVPQPNLIDDGAQKASQSFSSQTFSLGNTRLLSSNLEHPGNFLLQGPTSQRLFKRQSESKTKRELFLAGGSFFEGNLGLATIGENEPILTQQKENDEREPAEAESKAVMNVCTGCDEEPFEKALVIGWRTVSKKLYGATYAPANAQCTVF